MDITFISILKMYYSQGAIYLGKVEDPITQRRHQSSSGKAAN
jgi:hypothetical protein